MALSTHKLILVDAKFFLLQFLPASRHDATDIIDRLKNISPVDCSSSDMRTINSADDEKFSTGVVMGNLSGAKLVEEADENKSVQQQQPSIKPLHSSASVLTMENLCPQVLLRSKRYRTTIAELTVDQLKVVTTLNVSGCNITNQGADLLAAVLSETVSLENLNLSNANLNSTKAIKINNALKNISSVKVFSVNNNDITDESTNSMVAVIHGNSLLEKLNISHNKLSYSGALNIANSTLSTKNIKVLDISNNFITSGNIVDLAAALSKCPALQELNVSQNLLSLANILAIAQCFRFHPTLQALDLSGNIDSFSSACEFIVDVILSVNQALVNLNVCGRNIRPRYIEDYLSPPMGDKSTALSLQNLYILQHTSVDVTDLHTNYIKVSEPCPFINVHKISYNVDYHGGVFYNQCHNFVIVVPPGAVSQGDCVEIQAAVNYYGPYVIPNGFYPISSYFWFGANYKFNTPVYLIMNHYAKIRNLEDVGNLHVLRTSTDNNATKENLMMSMVSDGVYFDNEIRYCVLATDHFCSFCQVKGDVQIPEYLLACYCTFDDSVSGSYIAEVSFCPSNTECIKLMLLKLILIVLSMKMLCMHSQS